MHSRLFVLALLIGVDSSVLATTPEVQAEALTNLTTVVAQPRAVVEASTRRFPVIRQANQAALNAKQQRNGLNDYARVFAVSTQQFLRWLTMPEISRPVL